MRLEIDTKKKTIIILDDIKYLDLFGELTGLLREGCEDYEIKGSSGKMKTLCQDKEQSAYLRERDSQSTGYKLKI